MPVSNQPAYGFTLVCPDNVTLVPVDDNTFGADALTPPDNCHSIVVYNLDAANRIFVRFSDPLTISAANTVLANSTVIPALGSMTFGVGAVGEREYLSPAGMMHLFIKAESGNNLPVNITYLMGRGR